MSAFGLLVTLGIVFGDIGTSPLYVVEGNHGRQSHVRRRLHPGSRLLRDMDAHAPRPPSNTSTIALRADNKGKAESLRSSRCSETAPEMALRRGGHRRIDTDCRRCDNARDHSNVCHRGPFRDKPLDSGASRSDRHNTRHLPFPEARARPKSDACSARSCSCGSLCSASSDAPTSVISTGYGKRSTLGMR